MCLLLFLAAVAMTARQPPPPSVAEFAPQAVEQIKDAPTEQSSDFGSGEGGAGGAGGTEEVTTTTSTTLAVGADEVIDVARVRRCIGEPPRQIEDPQSPPCVNYFEGDNGGATWQGVTANEIRIGIPDWGENLHRALENFFNARFEFYGRKIKLVNTKPDFAGPSAEQQIAAAVKADEERQLFASGSSSTGGGYFYHRELARRGVISAVDRPLFSEAHMQRSAPYLYQYVMANDRYLQTYGSWLCARFTGGTARFTDDPLLAGKKRKLAVVVTVNDPEIEFDTGPLDRELQRCGADVGIRARIEGGSTGRAEQQSRDAVLRAKQANVTTFVCLCNATLTGNTMRLATANGYFPEWFVGTYDFQDDNFRMRTFFPKEHLTRTMGLTVQPRQVKPVYQPSHYAQKEVDPGHTGSSNSLNAGVGNIEYRILLLLASGIQMAGPNLTPETFERGLQKAMFPNPDHPTNPGKVGFAGSHAMTLDAAEVFWSDTARSPYPAEEVGSICYVDGGQRRLAGGFPSGDGGFFTSPCDSGA